MVDPKKVKEFKFKSSHADKFTSMADFAEPSPGP